MPVVFAPAGGVLGAAVDIFFGGDGGAVVELVTLFIEGIVGTMVSATV